MPYYIVDADEKHQGDLGTSTGIEELKKYASKQKLFHLGGFLAKGAALITEVFVEEVKAAKPASKDLRDILDNLSNILQKSELCVIIQDGVND